MHVWLGGSPEQEMCGFGRAQTPPSIVLLFLTQFPSIKNDSPITLPWRGRGGVWRGGHLPPASLPHTLLGIISARVKGSFFLFPSLAFLF